ncbi:LIM/homeobox protein Lhx9-like [Uranotaenia lowii]|uniref:LIM/homeobox protein Lhx9-like n=1 Tax=Uranotaenia lowii TaxID=190385 RepID=UPI0024797B65|nr:LIM/homeobox protein Lhx9-like [Uranotaenia lowii]
MLKDLIAAAETVTPEKCAGCGVSIRDRYYLLVADRAWHNQCLRCCKCLANLETELSCYARDGNIYCKDDYYRNFSSRRCARCGSGISASELVMRAKDLIFHVNCFSCTICGQILRGGDTAGLRDGRILCCEHYETDVLSEPETLSPQFYPGGQQQQQPQTVIQPLQQHQPQQQQQQQQQSQKGRPRKRKPSPQMLDEQQQSGQQQNQPPPSHDVMDAGGPLRLDLLHKELTVGSLDLSSYDGSQSPGSGGTLTPNCRTKRMRTSFKHHQLRTMKSYFAINQNPDAKDLKQLAQKTGLSKRVLQVWFQNARAKWRRNVMRQDGGLMSVGQPLGGLPSITTASLHHHMHASLQQQVAAGIGQGGGPGGPGGNPSNTSSSDGEMSTSQALEEMHNMTFAELY